MVNPPDHSGAFKRSPGYIPAEMGEYLFRQEFVSAHRMEAQRCLEILDLPAGALLLDIGCGTATATVELLNDGNQVIGLDLSKGMLKLAGKRIRKKKKGIDLVMGDILNLPFRDDVFDGVTCMDVTFGFFGPEGDQLQLKEMSRVLKLHGCFFVETFDKEYGKRNPGVKRNRAVLGNL